MKFKSLTLALALSCLGTTGFAATEEGSKPSRLFSTKKKLAEVRALKVAVDRAELRLKKEIRDVAVAESKAVKTQKNFEFAFVAADAAKLGPDATAYERALVEARDRAIQAKDDLALQKIELARATETLQTAVLKL